MLLFGLSSTSGRSVVTQWPGYLDRLIYEVRVCFFSFYFT